MATTATKRISEAPETNITQRILPFYFLLEGDAQSNGDRLLLEGNFQTGADLLKLEGDQRQIIGGTVTKRIIGAVA